MKKILVLNLILLCILCINSCTKKSYPKVAYPFGIIEDNLDSAKAAANTTNKNIFLMVHADWCINCQTFKTTVLQSTSIKNLLSTGIITSLIDGDKTYGKPIATSYTVKAYPTFLILNKSGTELARKVGLLTEAEFTSWVTPFLK
jgi:thioredoxin-related protein